MAPRGQKEWQKGLEMRIIRTRKRARMERRSHCLPSQVATDTERLMKYLGMSAVSVPEGQMEQK